MNGTRVEAVQLGFERGQPAPRHETRSRRQDRIATVVVWSLAMLGLSALGVIIVAIIGLGIGYFVMRSYMAASVGRKKRR